MPPDRSARQKYVIVTPYPAVIADRQVYLYEDHLIRDREGEYG